MEKFKKTVKFLLFPHILIRIILTPAAIAFLVYSMVYTESNSVTAIISYVLSAYVLTLWCVKIPDIIRFFKSIKHKNKYAGLWFNDIRFRMNVSLFAGFLWNIAYSFFQLCLGFYHSTFWYCSLAVYYILLAVMRLFLVSHTRKHGAGEKPEAEYRKYRFCGIVFLLMNVALTVIIFFMVYRNRTFSHHKITTIAMAAYTFTTFTFAVINIIKYRKYKSPVYSASKAINLAAACVSMLTLEATMLTTFGNETSILTKRLFLGMSGGVISVFIILMAIYMILRSEKAIKKLKE